MPTRIRSDGLLGLLALLTDDLDWHDLAACKGMPSDLFFPPRGGTSIPAKAICEQCAVKQECLDDALDHGLKQGVWGGTTERQRRNRYRKAWQTTFPTRR